jgi:hypothetical protein
MTINEIVSSKAWVIKTLIDEAPDYMTCAQNLDSEDTKALSKTIDSACNETGELLELFLALQNDLARNCGSPKINLTNEGGIDVSETTDLWEVTQTYKC